MVPTADCLGPVPPSWSWERTSWTHWSVWQNWRRAALRIRPRSCPRSAFFLCRFPRGRGSGYVELGRSRGCQQPRYLAC